MNKTPSKKRILEWIAESATLNKGFRERFGLSAEEAIGEDPYKEVLGYGILDERKKESIGETMTLREACDLMWNYVIVYDGDEKAAQCFKSSYGTYEFDENEGGIGLDALVRIDYYEALSDFDGYVYDAFATLVRE